MKSHRINPRTAAAIDAQIEKVLRGLGNPEPPLRIEHVRELLRLDRRFYSTSDTSVLRETVSRIRVGFRQIIERPMLLVEAVVKAELKALYLPDQKRILMDAELPLLKHRWVEAHEITHSLLDWHHEMMLGDTAQELTPTCHEHLEGEANYGAGRLIFLRDRFAAEALDMPLSLASITKLNGDFKNSISSTLWRFVETVGIQLPVVGLMTPHPHPTRRPANFDPAHPCRHFIQSAAFESRFSQVTEMSVFDAIAGYCGSQSGGPLGAADVTLRDDNGNDHVFGFETFFLRHKPPSPGEALTLGIYRGPRRLMVAA